MKVADDVSKPITSSVTKWETVLVTGKVILGKMKLVRRIFQGDCLSPLIFVLSMISLFIMGSVKPVYDLGKKSGFFNHLLFTDEMRNNLLFNHLLFTERMRNNWTH